MEKADTKPKAKGKRREGKGREGSEKLRKERRIEHNLHCAMNKIRVTTDCSVKFAKRDAVLS
eukprot:CAMPEP_0113887768 /NCGR_PEP_ID=MMETSP0780_2-20120614/12429_1 /TAXON_ID=652834 /ORGANISM="Palpitomonas bilix" /LENGTH=61 /DNA_ID=CAMNT_0000876401 /DNA_START=1 /DNA_END=182 /DNA_ORIENTATION=+ /assembly_acc=CAM_ASM_000599